MKHSENHRFIEQHSQTDITFKFFHNGQVLIIDNETDNELKSSELRGACLDFYIRKRIALTKQHLRQKIQQLA